MKIALQVVELLNVVRLNGPSLERTHEPLHCFMFKFTSIRKSNRMAM